MDKTLILNELKSLKNIQTEAEFSRFLGISPQNLSNWRIRNTFDVNLLANLFPEINKSWLLTGEGEMLNLKKEEEESLPIYNTLSKDCLGYINYPGLNKNSIITSVSGDAMSPLINNGDYIAIQECDWNVILYGQPYLVVTNSYSIVKRIFQDNSDDNFIVLKSENFNYPDVRLSKNDIINLYIVKQVISIKTIV